MGVEVGGIYGFTLGDGTGYGRTMVSLHCPNILWRYVIASIWALQVTEGGYVISHVRMEISIMMRSYVVREGCAR